MKHSGKARRAALKLILWTLVALMAVIVAGIVATLLGTFIAMITSGLVCLWVVFVLFTLYFFRDPEPVVPSAPNLVVSPAHGTVDAIDETTEPVFMGGQCRRVSIFLSVLNVHVQNAPVGGKVVFYQYTPGQFLNAMSPESAELNENLLLGIESIERPGKKTGLRLIAGLIARRIVPFVSQGSAFPRGERVSLIQFGSRTDLYLPLSAKVKVSLADKVIGGQTVVAVFE